VEIIPTVVDTETHKPVEVSSSRESHKQHLTVGWTGSHTTLFYLAEVVPILVDLQKIYDFTFLVIANKDPQLQLKHYQFIHWSKETEVEDLQQMDIGIMPLEDTQWAKGKCGFKLIQYGAIGIPSIGTSVGVNAEVIKEGETGFLVSDTESWKNKLELLLKDSELRNTMGKAARKKIMADYSVTAVNQKFIELFSS